MSGAEKRQFSLLRGRRWPLISTRCLEGEGRRVEREISLCWGAVTSIKVRKKYCRSWPENRFEGVWWGVRYWT